MSFTVDHESLSKGWDFPSPPTTRPLGVQKFFGEGGDSEIPSESYGKDRLIG